MSDRPNSYLNMYRNKQTGEEYAGMLRYVDRGYAEYIGKISTSHSDYLGTIPSDDEPNTMTQAGYKAGHC